MFKTSDLVERVSLNLRYIYFTVLEKTLSLYRILLSEILKHNRIRMSCVGKGKYIMQLF